MFSQEIDLYQKPDFSKRSKCRLSLAQLTEKWQYFSADKLVNMSHKDGLKDCQSNSLQNFSEAFVFFLPILY